MAVFEEVENLETFGGERLARLQSIEQRHFWFVGRRALLSGLIKRYLGTSPALVIDLGCGTGSMAALFAGEGYRVLGLDGRPEGLCARRTLAPGVAFVQGDVVALPVAKGCCDAVTLFDVLEHTDDVAILTEVRRALRPGGLLFLMVPAFLWLWSYRDEAAGHRHRYSRRGLSRLLTEAGFAILDLRYYQFFLFPVFVGARLLGRRTPKIRDLEDAPPPPLNSLLAAINYAEAVTGKKVRWPWGSSLVAVCQRLET